MVLYFARLTMRPLQHFEDAVQKVANGERNVRMTSFGDSELITNAGRKKFADI